MGSPTPYRLNSCSDGASGSAQRIGSTCHVRASSLSSAHLHAQKQSLVFARVECALMLSGLGFDGLKRGRIRQRAAQRVRMPRGASSFSSSHLPGCETFSVLLVHVSTAATRTHPKAHGAADHVPRVCTGG